MLRGIRWQLLALVAAFSLFLAVLLSRPSNETIFVPENPVGTTPSATFASTPAETLVSPTLPPVDNLPVSDVSTYREALVGQVQRLNPLLASLNPVDADITGLIFEGLTRINEYGDPVPALAESWIISSDGLEYVFTLRQDVLWQDGVPFTAEDVDYTMSLLRSPNFPGDKALGEFWRTVETTMLSPTVVRFRLTQPLGSFLETLRIGILPVHVLGETTAAQLAAHPFNLSPIGTGAYQLEALRSADNVRITAVDLRVAPVYRQRPEGQSGYNIDRITFHLYDTFDVAAQALQSGQVDGLAAYDRTQRDTLHDLAKVGAVTMRNGIEPTVGTLIFNWAEVPAFREQRVRAALQTGLNRDSLIDRNLGNQAIRADSPIPLNSWAYSPNLPWARFDINAAKNLLAAVDLNPAPEATSTEEVQPTEEVTPPTAESSGGFTFAILTPDDPSLVGVAQEIAAQWSLLGIAVTVDVVDVETYRMRLEAHEFQAALVELTKEGSADPDMYTFWHQGQYPDGKNYGGADDRTISEILEKARRDPFGINRIIDYREFQRVFIERAIAIPLYYPLYSYALNPRVQGVHLGIISVPTDRFLNIQNWSLTN